MTILGSLSGRRNKKQTPPSSQEPSLLERLRILQHMPTPADEAGRDLVRDEWRRQMPEILDELFWRSRFWLGEEEARLLFEGSIKRPAHRREDRTSKRILLDIIEAMQKNGVPEHKIPSKLAGLVAEHEPFKHKQPESIVRQIRGLIRPKNG
jgi:hypothetical protein